MGKLVEEVKQWNTPVVGAFLLWRFTSGYCEHHATGDGPVILLHFLAAAILTSPQLCEPISKRRPNLQSYVRCFEEREWSDLLMGVQQRVKDRREYTLSSIDIAVANGLLVWNAPEAKLYPKKLEKPLSRGCKPRIAMSHSGDKAEILGTWLSEHEVGTVASYLRVRF